MNASAIRASRLLLLPEVRPTTPDPLKPRIRRYGLVRLAPAPRRPGDPTRFDYLKRTHD
ncbi:MAG TPA: hypothetical protein VGY97_09905 [Solirubrobacteraceae bacterium]|nr:hypothetical protein [Solirubrobacteraceae bacterium]